MSIVLMSAAFKAQIKATQKLVLLALCDCANDQGECYPSVPTLMEKCSAAERTVQDAIGFLEREGFLSREFRTGRSTVYWITDPRKWRTPASAAPPQQMHHTPACAAPPPPHLPHPTPAPAAPITINEPPIEPSLNHPKPQKRGSSGDQGFEVFWIAYPKKSAKHNAEKAFAKLAPSAELLDDMLQAIARQKSWPAWCKDEGQFIPHPATWINGRRWEDQAQAPPAVPFESAKTRAARERVFAMTGGILGKPPTQQTEVFDAATNRLTALG